MVVAEPCYTKRDSASQRSDLSSWLHGKRKMGLTEADSQARLQSLDQDDKAAVRAISPMAQTLARAPACGTGTLQPFQHLLYLTSWCIIFPQL